MHIVIVIPRFYPLWGGTEIRVKRIAETLMARGFSFTVLTRRFNRSLPPYEIINGIQVHRFPNFRPFFYGAVKKWLKQNYPSIDLVHTFRIDKMGVIGAWANQKYGIPHIADIITNEARTMVEQPSGRKTWETIVAGSDALHCLSTVMVSFLKQSGVSGQKTWFRPNAVDIEVFKPAKIGIDSIKEKITVLCCGRIENQKGSDVLIAAWRLLPTEVSKKAELVLVGGGKWEKEFQTTTHDLPNIVFAGAVERNQILEYYQKASIYVQPSRYEGMSNALLEALACGLPLIATNIDGNVDLIKAGINGLLVPVEDAKALADALTQLINNAALQVKMGHGSRQIAEESFSLSKLFDDVEAKYLSLSRH